MSAPRLQDVLKEHPAHQAAVWREVCTVRTVEQLDALPDRAVLAVRVDRVLYRYAVTGDDLPALLVWHPDWEATP